MTSRPKLLDLYCCEGGAASGYTDAGFDVYGVDLFKLLPGGFSRKRYHGPAYTGDVLEVLTRLMLGEAIPFEHTDGHIEYLGLQDFDAIHASPPCQHASAGTRAMRAAGDDRHPALIEPTRELLKATGLPYVIENVKGAALLDPILLCGSMFSLATADADGVSLYLERHRMFETSWDMPQPAHSCWPATFQIAGVYGGSRRATVAPGTSLAECAPLDRHAARYERHGGYVPRSKAVQQELLGVDWMTMGGMAQCIPPAYARFMGAALLEQVSA
jgi:DNA (cytosine-5)-methyltransferase 1